MTRPRHNRTTGSSALSTGLRHAALHTPGIRPRRTNGFPALVTASLLVTTAASLAPTLVSALAVQIQEDLGLGEARIGMTLSAFFCVGALSSAAAGRMVERIGPAAALRLAAAVGGVTLVATGTLGRSWLGLLGLLAAAGLANALAQPAANLYVARGVTRRRQGLALGIQKSGIPTASLLGGLAVPTVGLTVGWSWAFVIGGLLAFAVSLCVPSVDAAAPATPAAAAPAKATATISSMDTATPATPAAAAPAKPAAAAPAKASATISSMDTATPATPAAAARSAVVDRIRRRPHAAAPAKPAAAAPTAGGGGPTPQRPENSLKAGTASSAPTAGGGPTPSVPVGQRTRRPRPDVPVRLLVVVSSSTCLAAMGSIALGSFFVLSSVEAGIGEGTAGYLLMAGSLVGIASRLAMGAGADRTAVSPWHMITAMFAVGSLAFVGLSAGSTALIYASLPFAFATSFAWPGLFHLAMVRSNPSAPGAATGITLTGSFTGAVCGPLLFGALAEATTYGWAWGFAAATSGAAATVMALASRLIERRQRAEPLPESQRR